jgi:hypothetical protein
VYFFSGLHKWNDVWIGGEALSRIFANEMWSRPLGRALLEFPALLAGLTWATLALELAAPVALFSPWKTETVRIATVSALVLMHLFIELTMSVGLFSYVALAGLSLFLPPRVWSTLCRERPPWLSADAIHCPSWRSAGAILCGLFLLYVLLWNLADPRLFGGRLAPLMPRPLWHFARATSIDQRWTMFAEPPAAGGWFTAEARLRDGRVVDLLRGGQIASDDPPPHPTGDFRNQRWQKLFANLLEPHLDEHRAGVAEYLARQWNRSRGPTEQVVVLDLYFFERHHPRRDEGVVIVRHTIARVELGRPEETDAFSELLDRLE